MLLTYSDLLSQSILLFVTFAGAVVSALITGIAFHEFAHAFSAMKLGDNEWLTVAASDGAGPQMPGAFDDSSRIVIRIKGADLTAYRAGKLTLEEVRKRVEVREF